MFSAPKAVNSLNCLFPAPTKVQQQIPIVFRFFCLETVCKFLNPCNSHFTRVVGCKVFIFFFIMYFQHCPFVVQNLSVEARQVHLFYRMFPFINKVYFLSEDAVFVNGSQVTSVKLSDTIAFFVCALYVVWRVEQFLDC